MIGVIKKWFEDPYFWGIYAAQRSGDSYELDQLYKKGWS